ncbi:MarR family winged helix-turn-helix transcriptional regulator [Streptomyces manipurensis]|uniref:MarR family winged helix-turn-helix transcriptional regulator n=1 Tax=Streptomyces manipurensis TaxID=1077945 RepID=UPI003C6FD8A5
MTSVLNPQILGQAENAHRAMLDKILGAHPGMTYQKWVGLTLTSGAGGGLPREELLGRLGGALKADPGTTSAAVTGLVANGLLEAGPTDSVRVTATGQERFQDIRSDVDGAMRMAYADISAQDMATAGRVLAQVTEQLNRVLAAA